ncbi:SDR family NAD(P)-dependent oxidoreductase [Nocardia blacklockiae]|uniref:SDR family NAD(P)-dependent oxidoreductase n=1 Tax=Nocardia blacklockiae TaxID=480036 RepID=UPI00189324D5|nr:SDR family NAD(P)-dependent oxidoreductase [Nocardia blacklockiae]MBF6175982.1 SDR family NAD(P)-dependent oxidoreductase [Nocardia blacklockiae]
MTDTSKTIAVFGAGPGLGRSVARRFGREGFRVALVARTRAKLDAMVGELAVDGIEANGFVADLADRQQLSGVVKAITDRFGRIDVLEYAPAGPEWMQRRVDIRACDPESFEFGLNMLLRTPTVLIESVLPGMLARGNGAVLFGSTVAASTPVPQLGNVAVAAAAARAYLHNLHVSLAGTGVYAGLIQVAGMVGGSESAEYAARHWDPVILPKPLDPADLAEAAWELYSTRDRFETTVGP